MTKSKLQEEVLAISQLAPVVKDPLQKRVAWRLMFEVLTLPHEQVRETGTLGLRSDSGHMYAGLLSSSEQPSKEIITDGLYGEGRKWT